MKSLILPAFLFCAGVSSLATASPAKTVLGSFEGNYTLAADEPENCPSRMFARIVAEDSLEISTSASRYMKIFSRVDRKRRRLNDDFGTYTDVRSALEGDSLTSYSRRCTGLILVKCGAWVLDQKLALTGDGAVMTIPKSAAIRDYAGFPLGNCRYSRD